jgi:hypothetical protein
MFFEGLIRGCNLDFLCVFVDGVAVKRVFLGRVDVDVVGEFAEGSSKRR